MREKFEYIQYDDWPEIFKDWLRKVTEDNRYPNTIEHHRGFVSLVTIRMPVADQKSLGGIRYGRVYTDSLGSFLEIKYRPVIVNRGGEDAISTLD